MQEMKCNSHPTTHEPCSNSEIKKIFTFLFMMVAKVMDPVENLFFFNVATYVYVVLPLIKETK